MTKLLNQYWMTLTRILILVTGELFLTSHLPKAKELYNKNRTQLKGSPTHTPSSNNTSLKGKSCEFFRNIRSFPVDRIISVAASRKLRKGEPSGYIHEKGLRKVDFIPDGEICSVSDAQKSI